MNKIQSLIQVKILNSWLFGPIPLTHYALCVYNRNATQSRKRWRPSDQRDDILSLGRRRTLIFSSDAPFKVSFDLGIDFFLRTKAHEIPIVSDPCLFEL